jgi:hypothetical protein
VRICTVATSGCLRCSSGLQMCPVIIILGFGIIAIIGSWLTVKTFPKL